MSHALLWHFSTQPCLYDLADLHAVVLHVGIRSRYRVFRCRGWRCLYRGLGVPLAVFRRPLLVESLVVIVVEIILIHEDHVGFSGHEVPPRTVFALLIHKLRNTQQFRHFILVAHEVPPFHTGLEDHFRAIARGRHIHHLDTDLNQVEMSRHLLPPSPHIVRVMAGHYVVEIHHTKPVQSQTLFLTPTTQFRFLLRFPGFLLGVRIGLVEVAHEDHQWQVVFQAVSPSQCQLLRGFPSQSPALFLFQPAKPLLKFPFLRPVTAVGGAFECSDTVHHVGHVVVSQQREQQVMTDVLSRKCK